MPLVVHDDGPVPDLTPGTLLITTDLEHNRIAFEVLPADGDGVGISLSEAEAFQIILTLVGCLARLRGWESMP